MDFEKLDGRGVLVTGGADGIGLALGRAARARGARVFLTDIAAEKLARSASDLGAASAPCDVTDADALARVVDHAWDEIGPIDLLCANAGVVTQGSLLEAPRAELDWILDVNVWGILNTCRPWVARVRGEGRTGHVLMTGSETSLSYPGFTRGMPIHAYVMSKHCVLAMADGLRAELEPAGIGVSVLCPGPVNTGLGRSSSASRPGRLGTAPPPVDPAIDPVVARAMGSLARSPDEVAACALEGLRRGLFVIPTHPHIRDDVAERFREIERGLDALPDA